jgi:hypothetical protein
MRVSKISPSINCRRGRPIDVWRHCQRSLQRRNNLCNSGRLIQQNQKFLLVGGEVTVRDCESIGL